MGGSGGIGLGVRVDVSGEVKFFCENSKKKNLGGGWVGVGGGGSDRGWGGEDWGSKVWGRWVM